MKEKYEEYQTKLREFNKNKNPEQDGEDFIDDEM